MSLVYMATNTLNGHKYIGYTSYSLERRKKEHFTSSNAKKPRNAFPRAIKKYGRGCFSFEVVKEGLSEDEGFQLEMRLIAELKPEYNVSAGGKAIHVPWNKERREAAIVAQRRPVVRLNDNKVYESIHAAARDNEINIGSVTQCCRLNSTTRCGLRFAYKSADKWPGPKKRKKHEIKNYDGWRVNINRNAAKRKKKVVNIDDGIVYESVFAAANALDRGSTAVCAAIKQNRRCAGKLLAYAA